MATTNDGMLLEWGARLFFAMPKKGKQLRNSGGFAGPGMTAGEVRNRVRQVVSPGARQVVVKISGGGRGMAPIAAHFRYISRQGKPEVGGKGQSLELEDENGNKISGVAEIKDLQADWRVSGSFVEESSTRREAFNIILSMPEGTLPQHVLASAREFARETFEGHKYVFVMHDDTDSPHVHLAVKAERRDGKRLNPRKADLQRWRELFAARLQDRGVNAVATRAASRGQVRAPQSIWRLKTTGEIRKIRSPERNADSVAAARAAAIESWKNVSAALAGSADPSDRALSMEVARYVGEHFEQGAVSRTVVPDIRRPGPKRSR